jgi:hypothetical protein
LFQSNVLPIWHISAFIWYRNALERKSGSSSRPETRFHHASLALTAKVCSPFYASCPELGNEIASYNKIQFIALTPQNKQNGGVGEKCKHILSLLLKWCSKAALI